MGLAMINRQQIWRIYDYLQRRNIRPRQMLEFSFWATYF